MNQRNSRKTEPAKILLTRNDIVEGIRLQEQSRPIPSKIARQVDDLLRFLGENTKDQR